MTKSKYNHPASIHFQLMTNILHELESSLLHHVRLHHYIPYPQEIQALIELQKSCESFRQAIKEARKLSK